MTAPRVRILLAEDNLVNRHVAVLTLRKLGYAADTVSNGLEVLQALERTPYDLVLMDCQMPEMDGYEATLEIRRKTGTISQIPIIALTAHSLSGDREKCLAAGMNDYLSKPIKVEELKAALARCLPQGAARGSTQEKESPLSARAPRHGGKSSLGAMPVDPAAFQRLKDLAQATEPSLWARVLEAFISDAARRIAALRNAIERKDRQNLDREAHALKGSCLNTGASRMAAICGEFREFTLTEQPEYARALADQLDAEFDSVRRQIERELDQASPRHVESTRP